MGPKKTGAASLESIMQALGSANAEVAESIRNVQTSIQSVHLDMAEKLAQVRSKCESITQQALSEAAKKTDTESEDEESQEDDDALEAARKQKRMRGVGQVEGDVSKKGKETKQKQKKEHESISSSGRVKRSDNCISASVKKELQSISNCLDVKGCTQHLTKMQIAQIRNYLVATLHAKIGYLARSTTSKPDQRKQSIEMVCNLVCGAKYYAEVLDTFDVYHLTTTMKDKLTSCCRRHHVSPLPVCPFLSVLQ